MVASAPSRLSPPRLPRSRGGRLTGLTAVGLLVAVAVATAATPVLASGRTAGPELRPGRMAETLRSQRPDRPTPRPPAARRSTTGRLSTAPAATAPARTAAARTARASTAPLSTWVVHFDSAFDAHPQAETAFRAAMDTWAHLVASPVTIVVDASAAALGAGVLGQAGPTDFVALNRDMHGGTARTFYPLALADAIIGSEVSSGSDITAQFDVTASDVYYGTDGQDGGKYDFESVVLHELGHGLGFLGSMAVDPSGHGFYGNAPTQPEPAIYDRFAVQSAGAVQGRPLLSYPNGSAALGAALTSGSVYWDGVAGKAAYRGRPVRLYAPSPFEDGSSFSHLSSADFPPGDPNSLMTPFFGPGEVDREPGPVVLGMFADMGWQVPAVPGVRYAPIDPVRVLDTRDRTDPHYGRLGAGQTIDVTVVGAGIGVPVEATAVVLNLTGVGPTAATDLRVYPTPRSGTARPLVSNLNLSTGDIRANLVTVPVGDGGQVRIYNSGGSIDVLGDVSGWYGPTASAGLHPLDPVRILDTRDGTGGVPQSPVGAGQVLDLPVTGGPRSVPDTATAVLLTVTATNATTNTDIRVYPTPADPTAAPPLVSSLNLRAGQVVPNLVAAKIGSGGAVRLFNSAGTVDLVADLAGWYDSDGTGGAFHLLAPTRVLDTRLTSTPLLGPGGIRDLPMAGVAGVPVTGAVAAVLNVTGVSASTLTDAAVYPTPTDGAVPLVSNLNVLAHQTAADLTVPKLGSGGAVRLRNSTGQMAMVADLAGWFGP